MFGNRLLTRRLFHPSRGTTVVATAGLAVVVLLWEGGGATTTTTTTTHRAVAQCHQACAAPTTGTTDTEGSASSSATADCGCQPNGRAQVDAFARQRMAQSQEEGRDTLPVYTSAQVAQRDGRSNATGTVWMSYGGWVYDVTDFVPLHPGGTARIRRAAGAAMEPYWFLHTQHFATEQPLQILQSLVVGRLADADQERIDQELEALLDRLDSFRLECRVTVRHRHTNGTKANTQGRHDDVDDINDDDKWFQFSLEDLQRLPKTDRTTRVGCPSRPGASSSSSLFAGVLLRDLLQHMGVPSSSPYQVCLEAMDGERVQLEEGDMTGTTDDDDDDILVAYEEDGKGLSQARGFPLRVIIPRKKRVIKWVKRMEIVVVR